MLYHWAMWGLVVIQGSFVTQNSAMTTHKARNEHKYVKWRLNSIQFANYRLLIIYIHFSLGCWHNWIAVLAALYHIWTSINIVSLSSVIEYLTCTWRWEYSIFFPNLFWRFFVCFTFEQFGWGRWEMAEISLIGHFHDGFIWLQQRKLISFFLWNYVIPEGRK